MIYLYIILSLISIIILGVLIPLIQFAYYKIKAKKKIESTSFNVDYYFPLELYNFDFDYNKSTESNVVQRVDMMDRGWIRGKNAFNIEQYEQMKDEEYKIDLP